MNEEKKPNWVVFFFVTFMALITLVQVIAKLWHQVDWPMWLCYWPMLVVIILVMLSTLFLRPPKE